MSGELSGRVAIVTGGASGIGAASAALLAEAGATVIVADVNEASGSPGRFVAHDVTSEAAWKSLLDDVLAREGRLDIMVNNAGVSGGSGNIETTTVENWQRVQAINSEGVFLGSKYAIAGMKKTGPDKPASKGSIVNISSVAGQIPAAGFAAYGTAKGALSMLTRELAQEFAPKIRVNAIAVGSTRTEALKTVLSPEIEQMMVALTPMARLGEVEDISACALYLASPAAAYLTGDIIGVNGGLTSLNLTMPRAFS